jgi:hypothetical protein
MHASDALDEPYIFGMPPRTGATHPYLRQHENARLLVLRGRPDIEARRTGLQHLPFVLQSRPPGSDQAC